MIKIKQKEQKNPSNTNSFSNHSIQNIGQLSKVNNHNFREYDNKKDSYFKHISRNSNRDLACELIIELGDMEFWNDKDIIYRRKITNVYKEQVYDLMQIVPEFKIVNAVIHFEEKSFYPNMHIVGILVKYA